MSEAAPETTAGTEDAEAEQLLAEAARTPEGQADPVEPEKPSNPWDNPETAKAEIERLRKENGAARTNAKQKAAEEARNELAQQIGKAIGLVQGDEAPDPNKLAEQLAESQRAATENAAALIRYKTAIEKQVPSHLMEFIGGSTAEEVEASIEKVLAAFAASKPNGPQPDPSQGQQGAPTSLDAQIAEAEKAGNTREAIRLKARKGMTTN